MFRPPLKLACILLQVSLAAVLSTTQVDMDPVGNLTSSEGCPKTCSSLFGRLDSPSSGRKVQDVMVSQRGEAKSGTSFMFEWSQGALNKICNFLQELYGTRSCVALWETREMFTLSFRPHDKTARTGRCSCEDVDRVNVSLSMHLKHSFPVEDGCPWQHPHAVAPEQSPFAKMNVTSPRNFDELRLAIIESGCNITEDNTQMVIFRDPRPMAASSYFFQVVHGWRDPERDGGVDDYVTKMFPIFCQWLAIRYVLFEEIMASQSTVFWYSDALADPISWHERWFEAMGLRVPASLVNETADDAVNERFDFKVMGRDYHPGGVDPRSNRRYEDELQPGTLRIFDAIMQRWLPPAFLDKIGISSSG